MATFHKHLKSHAAGRLEVEGIAVTDLAAQCGPPLAVQSENTICQNSRRILSAFADLYPAEPPPPVEEYARKEDHTLANKTWIYVDANTNEMRDAFDPRCSVRHVVVANDVDRKGAEVVDACGQTCIAGDILAKNCELPPLRIGDTLAFPDVGAYNESFACQSKVIPRSATVMVSNGRSTVVRRRETEVDVLSREAVPTWLMARPAPKMAGQGKGRRKRLGCNRTGSLQTVVR